MLSAWLSLGQIPGSVACMPKKSKGFTIIELLVVVAIITLLTALVVAALSDAKKKARDARRAADMHQVQTALEVYHDANSGYPATPPSQKLSDVTGIGDVTKFVDPLTQQSYRYVSVNRNIAGDNIICSTGPCAGYALIAEKEKPVYTDLAVSIKDGSNNVIATSSLANAVVTNTAYTTVAAISGGGGGGAGANGLQVILTENNISIPDGTSITRSFTVPAGAGRLRVATAEGTGNVSIYVKRGGVPTKSGDDCAKTGGANNSKECRSMNPLSDTWYVLLEAESPWGDIANMKLVVSTDNGPTGSELYAEHNYVGAALVSGRYTVFTEVDYDLNRNLMLTSSDGVNWEAVYGPDASAGRETIVAGNGLFYAGSQFGWKNTEHMTSADGVSWTNSTGSSAYNPSEHGYLVHLGSQFFNFPGYTGNSVYRSTDLFNWSTVATATLPFTQGISGAAYNGTNYVVMREGSITSGATGTAAAISSNGINWSGVSMPNPTPGSAWYGFTNNPDSDTVAYVPFSGGGKFVATDGNGVFTSVTGASNTWTVSTTTPLTGDAHRIFAIGARAIAVKIGSPIDAYYSDDGTTWQSVILPAAPGGSWNAVDCSSTFCVLSGNGQIATSPDGINWTVLNGSSVSYTPVMP